jgi:HSP20 family molecular chaperone IbpA
VHDRRDIGRIQDELEGLIADLWQVPGFAGLRSGFRPHVDCYRTDDPATLTIVVDLAGVEPSAVEIAVGDGALILSGDRRRPAPESRVSYFQMEIDYGRFQRRIPLAHDVDAQAAEATYERGLLKIVLPIAQRPKRASATIIVRTRP